MPIALETSKRKFHHLLDNLLKPPPATTTTTTTNHDPATPVVVQMSAHTKRARLAPRPGSTISLVPTPSTQDTQDLAPPYYVPWSHALFLQRLRTFADLTRWTPKPDAVNEVAWARRGWTCVGPNVNTVSCAGGGCARQVVVALRPPRKDAHGGEIVGSEDWGHDVDDELVQRYVTLLETGHATSCLWRAVGGCAPDVYRLPIARAALWRAQLRARYLSFFAADAGAHRVLPARARVVPRSSPSLPADLRADTPGDATDDEISTALAFAMLGWSCRAPTDDDDDDDDTDDAEYPIARCGACFRRLGLWLWTTPPSSCADAEKEEEEQGKEGEGGGKEGILDLRTNHREYCPWVCAASQQSPGAFAGLAAGEILLRLVGGGDTSTSSAGDTASIAAGDADTATAVRIQDDTTTTTTTQPPCRETVDKEDKARFARLKELTRSMGLKKGRGLKKSRLGGGGGGGVRVGEREDEG